jgi:hypothetical protein
MISLPMFAARYGLSLSQIKKIFYRAGYFDVNGLPLYAFRRFAGTAETGSQPYFLVLYGDRGPRVYVDTDHRAPADAVALYGRYVGP